MPCSLTRFRHNCTVGRLTPSCSAMDTLSWPARAPKIIRQRSATCCGVPYDDSHFSSCVRSAGSNWIAMLVFGMSEIIATTGNAVKLFKGHYTSIQQDEINCRLVDALDISSRGWDSPVFSLPAVALAAGKLMKLDAAKLTEAVNLAINDHISMGQTRRQVLSDWKGLADGEASRNAVFAAMLARGGLTGPTPIFEGTLGLFKQVSGEASIDVAKFGGHRNPFRINQCGMKAYPAVVFTQTAIVAATAIAAEVTRGAPVGYDRAAALERIASIEIATSRRGLVQTGTDREKWAPVTRDTADHSMPYITARAMFDGDITNDSYAPAKLKEPRILAFMQKITVAEDPVLTARTGGAVPTRITAILADGQRVSREVNDIPGFAGRPMQRPDIDRKFRGNIGKRWPREKTDAALQSLWVLENTQDIGALLAALTV